MDKVITEIIIGAVILTLLLSIIPIYRSSAKLVSTAGAAMDENENIKEVAFGRLPKKGDVVSGRYLLEFIGYSKMKYDIELHLNLIDKAYLINNKNKVQDIYYVKSNMFFEVMDIEKNNNYLSADFVYLKDD